MKPGTFFERCLRLRFTSLSVQNTEFTIKLKQLEDELLYKLSTAEGDITGEGQFRAINGYRLSCL